MASAGVIGARRAAHLNECRDKITAIGARSGVQIEFDSTQTWPIALTHFEVNPRLGVLAVQAETLAPVAMTVRIVENHEDRIAALEARLAALEGETKPTKKTKPKKNVKVR